jgi:hypothetical protein
VISKLNKKGDTAYREVSQYLPGEQSAIIKPGMNNARFGHVTLLDLLYPKVAASLFQADVATSQAK